MNLVNLVNLVNADGHESIVTGADAGAHYRTNGRDRLERTAVTAVAAITVHRVRLFCDRALVLAQAMQRATSNDGDSGRRDANAVMTETSTMMNMTDVAATGAPKVSATGNNTGHSAIATIEGARALGAWLTNNPDAALWAMTVARSMIAAGSTTADGGEGLVRRRWRMQPVAARSLTSPGIESLQTAPLGHGWLTLMMLP